VTSGLRLRAAFCGALRLEGSERCAPERLREPFAFLLAGLSLAVLPDFLLPADFPGGLPADPFAGLPFADGESPDILPPIGLSAEPPADRLDDPAADLDGLPLADLPEALPPDRGADGPSSLRRTSLPDEERPERETEPLTLLCPPEAGRGVRPERGLDPAGFLSISSNLSKKSSIPSLPRL
jgi:hypothetical protein